MKNTVLKGLIGSILNTLGSPDDIIATMQEL